MSARSEWFEAPSYDPSEVERRYLATLVVIERRRARRRAAVAIVAAAACVAVGWFGWERWRPVPSDASRIAIAEQAVWREGVHRFADSSTVEVSDGGTLVPDEATGVHRLVAGSGLFRVQPRRSGEFVVVADRVRVRVVGTVFSVERRESPSGGGVSVLVREGVVLVETAGRQWRIGAGERWDQDSAEGSSEPSPSALTETVAPPSGKSALGTRGSAPPATEAREELLRKKFAAATAARGRGDRAAAKRLLEEVVAAGGEGSFGRLAALELGRLELGAEGSSSKAVGYLEKSVEGASPLREDALARLVEAHERQGDLARCREVRTQFLREYPRSPLATQVRTRCSK